MEQKYWNKNAMPEENKKHTINCPANSESPNNCWNQHKQGVNGACSHQNKCECEGEENKECPRHTVCNDKDCYARKNHDMLPCTCHSQPEENCKECLKCHRTSDIVILSEACPFCDVEVISQPLNSWKEKYLRKYGDVMEKESDGSILYTPETYFQVRFIEKTISHALEEQKQEYKRTLNSGRKMYEQGKIDGARSVCEGSHCGSPDCLEAFADGAREIYKNELVKEIEKLKKEELHHKGCLIHDSEYCDVLSIIKGKK